MLKKTDGYLLTNSINHKFIVRTRFFPAAKTEDMKDYIKPTKRDFDPDLYIFHTGTSDLSSAKYNAEIPTDIINVAESLKSTHSNVVVSTIVPHVDNFKENPQKSINALYQNVERKIFH